MEGRGEASPASWVLLPLACVGGDAHRPVLVRFGKASMLIVNERLKIPLREIRFQFARSGGPGGQNVNKVSSKAVLRWNALASPSVPEEVKRRFCQKRAHRISRTGEVVIASERFRNQGRNAADCLERLKAWLAEAAAPPVPRRPTRPTRASRERRLQEKRARGEKKRRRQRAEEE